MSQYSSIISLRSLTHHFKGVLLNFPDGNAFADELAAALYSAALIEDDNPLQTCMLVLESRTEHYERLHRRTLRHLYPQLLTLLFRNEVLKQTALTASARRYPEMGSSIVLVPDMSAIRLFLKRELAESVEMREMLHEAELIAGTEQTVNSVIQMVTLMAQLMLVQYSFPAFDYGKHTGTPTPSTPETASGLSLRSPKASKVSLIKDAPPTFRDVMLRLLPGFAYTIYERYILAAVFLAYPICLFP